MMTSVRYVVILKDDSCERSAFDSMRVEECFLHRSGWKRESPEHNECQVYIESALLKSLDELRRSLTVDWISANNRYLGQWREEQISNTVCQNVERQA